jgi:O-antigen/teichoic acid export membrane protein
MSRAVLKNFLSLSVLHAANYVVPLVTMPYLTRTLGAGGFGRLAIAQAVVQYFVILVDFGFGWSSSRLAALHKDDPLQISSVFWSTMYAKGVLVGASLALLGIGSAFHWAEGLRPAIWANSLAILGAWLFPSWFFQGLERMTTISLINILTRASSVPLIFYFVRTREDLVWAAFIPGLTVLFAGLIGLRAALKLGLSRPPAFRFRAARERLFEGLPIFLSVAGVSLYSTTNVILLGFVAPPQVVGYFAGADKIRVAAIGLIPQMTNAVFPKAVKSSRDSVLSLVQAFRKFFPQIALGVAIFLFLFLGSWMIVPLVLGRAMSPAIAILQVLSVLGLVIPFNHILGINILVARGYSKPFSQALLLGGLSNFAFMPMLGGHFGAMGAAVALVLVEIVVFASLLVAYGRVSHVPRTVGV